VKRDDPRPGERALIVGLVPHPLSRRYNNTECVALSYPTTQRYIDLYGGGISADTCTRVRLHDGERTWIPTRYLVRRPPDDEARDLFERSVPRGPERVTS
jgi:hypothetical protein